MHLRRPQSKIILPSWHDPTQACYLTDLNSALFLRMAAEMKDDLANADRKIDDLTKTLTDLKSQIDVLSDSLSKVSNKVDSYDQRLGSFSNIWRQEAKRFRKGTVTIELISANFKHLLRRLAKQSNSILPLLSQNRQTPDTRDD